MNREVETRVRLFNVCKDSLDCLIKSFHAGRVLSHKVQRYKCVDIYNSSHFRIKKVIGHGIRMIEGMPVPVQISMESNEMPMDAAKDLEENMYDLVMKTYFNIHPMQRIAIDCGLSTHLRVYYDKMDVANVVLEFEFQDDYTVDKFKRYMYFVKKCINRLYPQDFEIDFQKRPRPDRLLVLKHPRQLANSPLLISPKWDGVFKKVTCTECEVHMCPRGFRPSDIFDRREEIRVLARDHMYVHQLLKRYGVEVEAVRDGRNVVIDIDVGYDKATRIAIIRDSDLCGALSVLNLNFTPQQYHPVALGDLPRFCHLKDFTDGFIIHTIKRMFKIKPRKLQTIDLLMNPDYILVSSEGIAIGNPAYMDMGGLPKERNVVYEVAIKNWNRMYEAFHACDSLAQSVILRGCHTKCIRIRRDKGACANSFKTICNYLTSDLFHFLYCIDQ